MTTTTTTHQSSIHCLGNGWRWVTVLIVPPLLALMAWGVMEAFRNNFGDGVETNLWAVGFAVVMMGGVSLSLLAGLIWVFRARVVLDGDRMTVRGAFLTVVVTPERMESFKYVNDQLLLYLKDRHFALQLGYFERFWEIDAWIRQRTRDLEQEFLDAEDKEIAEDSELGFSEEQKAVRLEFLHKLIRRSNLLVYMTAVFCFVNFLFVEHHLVGRVTVALLVSIPVLLDLLALSNRGHIRIDYDDGSRYPQIFTGTMACGITLVLISVLDRGALLNDRMYELVVVVVAVKGLLWCFIDRDRFRLVRQRGRAVLAITVVAYFIMPAFWAGGSLYQLNKHLDQSPVSWHSTEVLDKNIKSGKTASYVVELVPWATHLDDPVEVVVRRQQYAVFEEGMRVRVGVRDGAWGVPWVYDLQPDLAQAQDEP